MAKVIRVSVSFDYYPDEDELIQEASMTEDEITEYCKSSYLDDIYSMVKYNELHDGIQVEIINEVN